MMHEYPKILALGHKEIAELFFDPVVIQEKIDGSQFSFGISSDESVPERCENTYTLWCRSHHQEIDIANPPKMFGLAVETVKRLKDQLIPGVIYRAEAVTSPKHNVLTYGRIPTGGLILFDIDRGIEDYTTPLYVQTEAQRLGLEVVPTLLQTTAGLPVDLNQLKSLLEKESILGGTTIEGVVIKNYHRFDVHTNKCLMGKYVSEKFKERAKIHQKEYKGSPIELIGARLRTEARFQKAVQYLRERTTLTGDPTDIGPLLKVLMIDIEAEEAINIKDELWVAFRKAILQQATKGFAEWYKNQLITQQFKDNNAI